MGITTGRKPYPSNTKKNLWVVSERHFSLFLFASITQVKLEGDVSHNAPYKIGHTR
jgi:hypothetical protein